MALEVQENATRKDCEKAIHDIDNILILLKQQMETLSNISIDGDSPDAWKAKRALRNEEHRTTTTILELLAKRKVISDYLILKYGVFIDLNV